MRENKNKRTFGTSSVLVLTLLLICPLPSFAEEFRCETQITEQTIRAEAKFRQRVTLDMYGDFPCLMVPLSIGIRFKLHIIRNSDGSGGLTSVKTFDDCLNSANAYFQSSDFELNVGPRFIRDNDVLYHDNSTFINIDSDEESQQLHDTYSDTYLDVYIVESLMGGDFSGKATLGPDNIERAWIILTIEALSNPTTLAHETGHVFSLYHTHETRFGLDCSEWFDCYNKGDLICDTPADPGLQGHVNERCEYDNYANYPEECATWAGTPYHPLVNNIMSYSRTNCRNSFTEQQACRMRWYVFGMILDLARGTQTVNADANIPSNDLAVYSSISDAVAAAAPGDYVVIQPGLYPEDVVINKEVFLVNARPSDVIVRIGSGLQVEGIRDYPSTK